MSTVTTINKNKLKMSPVTIQRRNRGKMKMDYSDPLVSMQDQMHWRRTAVQLYWICLANFMATIVGTTIAILVN